MNKNDLDFVESVTKFRTGDKADENLERLISLCEGLELQEIKDLLTKSPEHFKKIGEILTLMIKR